MLLHLTCIYDLIFTSIKNLIELNTFTNLYYKCKLLNVIKYTKKQELNINSILAVILHNICHNLILKSKYYINILIIHKLFTTFNLECL